MLKSFKYRAYLDLAQRQLAAKTFGCARWVFNWALSLKIDLYREAGYCVSGGEISALFTRLRHEPGTEWLSDVGVTPMQQVLRDVETAFKNWIKHGAGFPNFKNKYSRKSFRLSGASIKQFNFETGEIKVSKLGWVKVVFDRQFLGTPKNTFVSKDKSGKYFISVLVDDAIPIPPKAEVTESTTVGIDFGLTTFATISNGEEVANPRFHRKHEKRLKRLHRQHDRSKLGSKRRERKRVLLAKKYEKARNQRKDFLHKFTTKLVSENQAIAVEDLNVSGMVRNKKLAKSIADAGWSMAIGQLEYKCEWRGKTLVKVGRFFPSSKRCTCGVINRGLRLQDRIWHCASCGAVNQRDPLASRNIKAEGLRILGVGRVAPEFMHAEDDREVAVEA